MDKIKKTFDIVIITTKARQSLLKDCLRSLTQSLSNSPALSPNIFLVLNDNFDSFPELEFPLDLQLLSTDHPLFPSVARNVALKQCQSEYVLFLDDDVILPKDYFKVALIDLEKSPDVLGGPDAPILGEKGFQQLFSHALHSPLTFGPTYKRHQSPIIQEKGNHPGKESNLILCHMWFRRSLFESFRFSENLFRNEENLLIWELKEAGKVIEYNASLFVHHHRKDNFKKVIKTYMLSGFSRVKSFYLEPKSFNPLYLLPLLAFLGLIFAPSFFIFLLSCYSLLLFAESLVTSIKYLRTYDAFQLTLIKILVLLSYMSGSIYGVLYGLLKLPGKFARKQFGRFKENTI